MQTYSKAQLDWMASHRCRHGHTYLAHQSCLGTEGVELPVGEIQAEKHLFIGDMQIPFQDQDAIDLVFGFADIWQPDHVWWIGDIIDFYQISRFDKDPRRINDLQRDIDKTVKVLAQGKKVTPKANHHFIGGNHEHRLEKFKMKNSATHSLRALRMENLLPSRYGSS